MILWWMKCYKDQHLFKIEIFSNNISVYYNFFIYKFNTSVMKTINSSKKKKENIYWTP